MTRQESPLLKTLPIWTSALGTIIAGQKKGWKFLLKATEGKPFLTAQNESHTKEIFKEHSDNRVSHTAFDMLHGTSLYRRSSTSKTASDRKSASKGVKETLNVPNTQQNAFTLFCKVSEQIDLWIKTLQSKRSVSCGAGRARSDFDTYWAFRHALHGHQQSARGCQPGCSTEGTASISEWDLRVSLMWAFLTAQNGLVDEYGKPPKVLLKKSEKASRSPAGAISPRRGMLSESERNQKERLRSWIGQQLL